MKKGKTGFTLIELMIVVAIIAILAAIAIPEFANLVAKSQEADTKGNLGVLRSALAIYYGDNEGIYPFGGGSVPADLPPRYLQAIPNYYYPTTPNNVGHTASNAMSNLNCAGVAAIPCYQAWLAGGGIEFPNWIYDTGRTDPNFGMIIAGCAHSDLKGQPWYNN